MAGASHALLLSAQVGARCQGAFAFLRCSWSSVMFTCMHVFGSLFRNHLVVADRAVSETEAD